MVDDLPYLGLVGAADALGRLVVVDHDDFAPGFFDEAPSCDDAREAPVLENGQSSEVGTKENLLRVVKDLIVMKNQGIGIHDVLHRCAEPQQANRVGRVGAREIDRAGERGQIGLNLGHRGDVCNDDDRKLVCYGVRQNAFSVSDHQDGLVFQQRIHPLDCFLVVHGTDHDRGVDFLGGPFFEGTAGNYFFEVVDMEDEVLFLSADVGLDEVRRDFVNADDPKEFPCVVEHRDHAHGIFVNLADGLKDRLVLVEAQAVVAGNVDHAGIDVFEQLGLGQARLLKHKTGLGIEDSADHTAVHVGRI